MAILPPTFHPIFVHFTIALFPTAALFATLHAWKALTWAKPAALWLMGLALLATVFTVASGLYEEDRTEDLVDADTHEAIETHEFGAFITAGYFALVTGLALWKRHTIQGRRAWMLAIALWIGVLLLTGVGWMGGRLVFEMGVGTPGMG